VGCGEAGRTRPALDIADIFRTHGPAWRRAQAGHSLSQLKVVSAIEVCRTAELALPSCGSASTCTPILRSFTFNLYNSTTMTIMIANGAGWAQISAMAYTLAPKALSFYYFDPSTQTARQIP
jgi:hypothetical protein